MNHTTDCAFAVSFGDEPCDCEGPADVAEGTTTDVAKHHLELARAFLKRRPA